ncbi:hypothetical protein AWV80_16955 [Cupriavidus sp. UYMU48A]|nr:hypothetical protein AWV80_16955 [Cupriavidus sp. UYMU48A]
MSFNMDLQTALIVAGLVFLALLFAYNQWQIRKRAVRANCGPKMTCRRCASLWSASPPRPK